jgi:hypothetical protein
VPALREQDPPSHLAPPRPSVPAPVERASAALFGALSAARRARIFHPRGDGFEIEVEVDRPLRRYDGIPLLSERGVHPGVARLSRAIGIPAPLPDLLGLAFRIETAGGPQDLLLISSGRSPGLRHLLLPTRGAFSSNPYSSILPYRVGDQLRLFGAEPVGPLEYELRLAPLDGAWEPFARLRIRAALDPQQTETLRLNPWNTLPGLKPVGPLNGLRRSAYAGSQRGRSAARAEEVTQ